MNFNEFMNEEFYRVEHILGNIQTAINRILEKEEPTQWRLLSEIRDIRNALYHFEMSFRAERDKIREKEEKVNDELNAMISGYYSNLLPECKMFRSIILKGSKTVDLNVVNGFADGWYKCKKYYGIQ